MEPIWLTEADLGYICCSECGAGCQDDNHSGSCSRSLCGVCWFRELMFDFPIPRMRGM